MDFFPIQIEIAWREEAGNNKVIYKYLDRLRVGYDHINYYKEHFVVNVYPPDGKRIKIRFYSPDRSREDLLSYLKQYLKHNYNLDEKNVATTKDLRQKVRLQPKAHTEADVMARRFAVNNQERDLIEEIQRTHPDLTDDLIIYLLRSHSRSEIIAWNWRRGKFYPKDLYTPKVSEIDLMDTALESSMM